MIKSTTVNDLNLYLIPKQTEETRALYPSKPQANQMKNCYVIHYPTFTYQNDPIYVRTQKKCRPKALDIGYSYF